MIDFRNKVYTGSEGRASLFDCEIPDQAEAVIIFVHGYKGYKDWGAWNLLQQRFVNAGYGFVKFNMTHNGGTIENPIDFPDLDAFSRNRYTYELMDLNTIVNETERMISQELEQNIPIFLLGHSRGGGMAILQAAKDDRIAKVISLAGISDIENRFPEGKALEEWKKEGVRYVENRRTKQQMPHLIAMYEDFQANKDELDIQSACEALKTPFLQVHGDMDLAVSISEGQQIAQWTNTRLEIIKGAGHTFGSKQPWETEELPEDLERVVKACIEFFED